LEKHHGESEPIEVQKHSNGIDYAVSKEDLVKHTEKNGGGWNPTIAAEWFTWKAVWDSCRSE